MSKIVDRIIKEFAYEKLSKLDVRTKKLISLANFDLHHGCASSEDDFVWPGFEKACNEIAESIESQVSDVWVNIQDETVQDFEPNFEEDCESSNDWFFVKSKQLKAIILGDLWKYI